MVSNDTRHDLTTRLLRVKTVDCCKDATEEERLDGLKDIRHWLLHMEAVQAVSWLWQDDVPIIDVFQRSTGQFVPYHGSSGLRHDGEWIPPQIWN